MKKRCINEVKRRRREKIDPLSITENKTASPLTKNNKKNHFIEHKKEA